MSGAGVLPTPLLPEEPLLPEDTAPVSAGAEAAEAAETGAATGPPSPTEPGSPPSPAAEGSPQSPASQPAGARHPIAGWAVVLVVACGLAVLLRLFVVQTFYVPSASMVPTLQVGDRMLVLKIGYTIDRGDILVFRQPPRDTSDGTHEDLVKRVIGLPGETIWSVGNTVYIDGKPLSEPWLPKGTILGQAIKRQTIPPGDYFMMGDNRSDSFDSRDWGVLPKRLVVGEVLVVMWRDGGLVFHIQ